MTDNHGLHSIDSVRADDLGTGQDTELRRFGRRGVNEAPPQPSCGARVGRTQDEEHALAALQSADRSSARAAVGASDEKGEGQSQPP